MADSKELTSNVYVAGPDGGEGKWYGPDYPQNDVTDDVLAKIDNPAAFAPPAPSPFDFSDRSTDDELASYGAGRPHEQGEKTARRTRS